MNGSKHRNLREKSKYRRVLTDGKNEINQSEDLSNVKMKKNSMTIKVNPLINGKKIISKKLFNKKIGSIDFKLNNNLETSLFLNESKIEPKRSKKIFSESYKKSPVKMNKNQTYKKQEKKNGYNISNNKDIKKENNNQKTKHLKINSFIKKSIKKSPNKGQNISPKNIFKQKLFVKLKKRNNNYLSPETNDEIKINDDHTELKNNNIDISIYNTNDNYKNFEEQNNYNKLKSIDLKIKNLTKKKRNEKNEEEKKRSGSHKERTISKQIIQKKNSQKVINNNNSKKLFNKNKIKIKRKRNINRSNNNSQYLNKKIIHLKPENETTKNSYMFMNTINNNNIKNLMVNISINIDNEKESYINNNNNKKYKTNSLHINQNKIEKKGLYAF